MPSLNKFAKKQKIKFKIIEDKMFQLLLIIIYFAFVSLGLPDSLLGAAWPSIYPELGVSISFAGVISMIIAGGTILSSLLSDRFTRKFGTGIVTTASVLLTAVALFGFSFSNSFVMLCLWSIPYGFGAGSVDASLNNYVALNYASRHMSWLHCMWGIGASVGPYIMGIALTSGQGWGMGYRYIAILQVFLTIILVLSLPLWKKSVYTNSETSVKNSSNKPLTLREIIKIPGTKEVMLTFFCYCALEQTTGLWMSSYLVLYKGLPSEAAASFASLFFAGITVGRALSGFLTIKFNDTQMIRIGQGFMFVGIVALLLPFGEAASFLGFILIGLGCAPVFPCVIHSTPAHFGADRSQAIIGIQMSSAYVGNCLMPPLFGLIANYINVALLPLFLLLALFFMVFSHERLLKKTDTKIYLRP